MAAGGLDPVRARLLAGEDDSWFQAALKVNGKRTEETVEAWGNEAPGTRMVFEVNLSAWTGGDEESLATYLRGKLRVVDTSLTDVYAVLKAHVRAAREAHLRPPAAQAPASAAASAADAAPAALAPAAPAGMSGSSAAVQVVVVFSGIKTTSPVVVLMDALYGAFAGATGLHGCVVVSDEPLPAPERNPFFFRVEQDGSEQVAVPFVVGEGGEVPRPGGPTCITVLDPETALDLYHQLNGLGDAPEPLNKDTRSDVDIVFVLFGALRAFWKHIGGLRNVPEPFRRQRNPFVEPSHGTPRYDVCARFANTLVTAVVPTRPGLAARGRCFVVTGPKGSGKTWLLQNLLLAASLATAASRAAATTETPIPNPVRLAYSSAPKAGFTPGRLVASVFNATGWPGGRVAPWAKSRLGSATATWFADHNEAVLCVMDEHQDLYKELSEYDLVGALDEQVYLGTGLSRVGLVATGLSSCLTRLMFARTPKNVEDLATEFPGASHVRDLNNQKWTKAKPLLGFGDTVEVARFIVSESLRDHERAAGYLDQVARSERYGYPGLVARSERHDEDVEWLRGLLLLSAGRPAFLRAALRDADPQPFPVFDDVVVAMRVDPILRSVLTRLCALLGTADTVEEPVTSVDEVLRVLVVDQQTFYARCVTWEDQGFLMLSDVGQTLRVPLAVRIAVRAFMDESSPALTQLERSAMLLSTGDLAEVECETLMAESLATPAGRALLSVHVGQLPAVTVPVVTMRERRRLRRFVVRQEEDGVGRGEEWAAVTGQLLKVWPDSCGVDLIDVHDLGRDEVLIELFQVKMRLNEASTAVPDVAGAARKVNRELIVNQVKALRLASRLTTGTVRVLVVLVSLHSLGQDHLDQWKGDDRVLRRPRVERDWTEEWVALGVDQLRAGESIFTDAMKRFAAAYGLTRFTPATQPAPADASAAAAPAGEDDDQKDEEEGTSSAARTAGAGSKRRPAGGGRTNKRRRKDEEEEDE